MAAGGLVRGLPDRLVSCGGVGYLSGARFNPQTDGLDRPASNTALPVDLRVVLQAT